MRRFLLRLFTVLLLSGSVAIDARELHWKSIDSNARLDDDGNLHVVETQVMVFTGDWNGGERTFSLYAHQDLTLTRLARVGPDGREIDLVAGDLDAVDEYKWENGSTLRWRSRLPEDPVFENTEITYRLYLVYSGILRPLNDGTFQLDHDFAFADREGVIERFTLELNASPSWRVAGAPVRVEAANLPPGNGYVLSRALEWRGQGRPAGVKFPPPFPLRAALAMLLAAGILWLAIRFAMRESAHGRFSPLPSVDSIDEAFLDEHIFAHKPEAIGAAWDGKMSSAEVAAVIARLVTERKLSSRIETRGFFRRKVLCLELLVDKHELRGYENSLIDSLFFGSRSTDTDLIRSHYSSSGFDPLKIIREPVTALASSMGSRGPQVRRRDGRLIVILLAASVLLLIAGGVASGGDDVGFIVVGGIATIIAAIVTLSLATNIGHRVRFVATLTFLAVLPFTLLTSYFVGRLLTSTQAVSILSWCGMATLLMTVFTGAFSGASAPDSSEHVAMRKRLAAARLWFIRELRSRTPRLRDEWFPYLLAFGLGSRIDRWFRAFGSTESSSSGSGSSGGGIASGGSSGTGGGWSGGGGAFGGAGASGSWAMAAGAMASGVSSSSSSSGGGGGGGSSGGGGGGGW